MQRLLHPPVPPFILHKKLIECTQVHQCHLDHREN